MAQILRDDTALGALPAVLDRLTAFSGVRAAVAFAPAGRQPAGRQPAGRQPAGRQPAGRQPAGRQPAGRQPAGRQPAGRQPAGRQPAGRQPAGRQPVAVLAMHPPGAVEPGLLARIGALTLTQRDADPAHAAPVQVTVESDGPAISALLAYSAPVDGQCLCALALLGDTVSWDEELRTTAQAVVAIVASQIRHTRDLAKLAEREALTEALVAASPTAILAMDDRGHLIEFNPAAERLSGYRRAEVLGRNMSDVLVPERDRPRFLQHIKTFVTTGDPEEFTGQIRIPTLRADGTERTVELTPVQLTIGGQIIFTGFLRDLTEIERSHAALADQTERLNYLIAAAVPGILISDEQGLITHINPSLGAMFGIEEPEQLVGTPAGLLVHRIAPAFTDPGEFARCSTEVIRARQPVFGEQLKTAGGRTVKHDYWPVLVDDHFRGAVWLAWDVSESAALAEQRSQALEAELAARRLAEQAQRQLTEQNERLRRLDESRNQFLAIVSHELRTPLTSIVSFTELIKGEAEGLTPDGLRFLDIIERNADRLHRLVGDLLMLDRLDAGALPLDLAPVALPELVSEAVRSASAGAVKQGITIKVTTGEGPAVPADHRRLMQVFDNLIANAVKFSHRNSQVRVTAAYGDGRWRIDVADDGIGIPADEAGQLFTRFVRGSNARTAGLPGTGLGLSIVKVLVEMHGGHIEADSVLGRGSTFRVYLPAPAPERP